jgi:hypothetical protein
MHRRNFLLTFLFASIRKLLPSPKTCYRDSSRSVDSAPVPAQSAPPFPAETQREQNFISLAR